VLEPAEAAAFRARGALRLMTQAAPKAEIVALPSAAAGGRR
jgi:hypothetical protein